MKETNRLNKQGFFMPTEKSETPQAARPGTEKETCRFRLSRAFFIFIFLLIAIMAQPAMAETPAIWKVIMAEAVSEGRSGMYAVACVIRNRGGKLNGFMGAKRPDLDHFVQKQGQRYIHMAKEIQEEVFERNGTDITKGATHFENIRSFGMPYWAKGMIVTARIGRHTFFKDGIK